MTAAKNNFDKHIHNCNEAIEIYEYLHKLGYSADFGLRYIWVASISALDHYISELIIEISTEQFTNGGSLTKKILREGIPLDTAIKINNANPVQTILEFRQAITNLVRFRTFQKAQDVADGLSFIWEQKHKWKKISYKMGITSKNARDKLNNIVDRRNLIVHNADYNNTTGELYDCELNDAKSVINHITKIVEAIDNIVTL